MIECVNEIAVAKVLVEDPALQNARIEYEPDLLVQAGRTGLTFPIRGPRFGR